MKNIFGLALVAALALVGCERRQNENRANNNYQPVDTYCLQYGQYDQSRCPGLGGYGGYGYGYGGGWANYNYYGYNGGQYYYSYNNPYNYSGCGNGYAPVVSYYGLSCYNIGYGYGGGYSGGYGNYYWWAGYGSGYQYGGYPGFLVACGIDYSGTCPSGYYCSQSNGLGVCVR